ncbi:MAG: response regulator [Bacteroidetes bacterium]|nr:response regulator [Bacteroidota bacterium]MBU1580458.1 response regulator [Bacteroidota bacterium]MBU2558180.1 response regulator [Bacteroidota bacterium]
MGKVKILVVEDEIIIADDICNILSKLGYDALDPVINYTEAIEAIEKYQPDLAILDIQLAGSKDGIDLAWKIKEDYEMPFIFLTSNADPATVERAKKVTPPAYLVKPFNKDDLYTSIEMALYNYSSSLEISKSATTANKDIIIKDAFFIRSNNLFHKVKFVDITYVKAEHVYVEIYTNANQKHLSRGSLIDFPKKLPDNFFRTHRSFIINLYYLDAINYLYVIVDGTEVPIGKNYRNELLKRVNIE